MVGRSEMVGGVGGLFKAASGTADVVSHEPEQRNRRDGHLIECQMQRNFRTLTNNDLSSRTVTHLTRVTRCLLTHLATWLFILPPSAGRHQRHRPIAIQHPCVTTIGSRQMAELQFIHRPKTEGRTNVEFLM
ncbi:hypothetical protein CBL_07893 [Carabus blaptoides fortunei]